MLWIASGGGPLVLIPADLAAQWRGATHGSSDYDAACKLSDYAGVIRWHEAEVLVLNDEPLATTSLVACGGLVFLRWRYAPDEAAILALLPNIAEELPAPCEEANITCASRDHVLFDAGASGNGIKTLVRAVVEPGRYAVQTHVWTPSESVSLLAHVFRRR